MRNASIESFDYINQTQCQANGTRPCFSCYGTKLFISLVNMFSIVMQMGSGEIFRSQQLCHRLLEFALMWWVDELCVLWEIYLRLHENPMWGRRRPQISDICTPIISRPQIVRFCQKILSQSMTTSQPIQYKRPSSVEGKGHGVLYIKRSAVKRCQSRTDRLTDFILLYGSGK